MLCTQEGLFLEAIIMSYSFLSFPYLMPISHPNLDREPAWGRVVSASWDSSRLWSVSC